MSAVTAIYHILIKYGAFTYALRDKEMVANYMKNQRVHHQRESFEEEYRKHLLNAGIE